MADPNTDDIEVVIEGEDPKKQATEGQKPESTSEDELAALKAQLAEATERDKRNHERAEAATREATTARTEQQRAIEDRFSAQEVAIVNAMTAAQSEAQALEQELERLLSEGKAPEYAQATRKLARVEMRIAQAEQQKDWLEQQKAGYQSAVAAEAQRQKEAAEAAQQQPQVSQRAQAWINAHPRMKIVNNAPVDPNYYNAAIGAHNLARLKGIPVDSDQYFEFIETQLGERTPAVAEANEGSPKAMVAAPPSRSTPTAQRQSERRLTLTAQEREMADITMSHVKDPAERYKRYAMNKQRMMAENPLQ